ncbi:MAG: ATP-binding cassette domain-containing protein [Burkholderiales bacterium]|nr:ATP-binding cassette domain-containing protein [Burkholderiales bacterium]
MTTSARLVVRRVHHAFARHEVLAGIDFDVAAGRAVALVGPSGCGKTTLMNLCAGLLRVREGTIESGFANPACVFQQPRLLPWKTALDNVAFGLKAAGVARPERDTRARDLALRMGLAAGDLEKFPHQLSGGMQSRVALARALVLEPDLLLLDEPFSALDIGLKEELYGWLLADCVARGAGVLMITHDLMEAVRLSDTILVMAPSPGRIVTRFDIALPALEREDAWVYRHTAQILQSRIVRECFGLAPLARGVATSRLAGDGSGIREIAALAEAGTPAAHTSAGCAA